ncbi:ImmA/IrrE family metallo-endopeptidase [Actinomadura sp. GC306]|nr:ImmA/IrrE family metallo-endopeptidase [Actinomadura sp. GC306]
MAAAFDPARLTQARLLMGFTKTRLAEQIGVSAAAVGQWESGTTPPRPDHIERASEVLDVPLDFFVIGRPHARLDASAAHFRKLRSTRVGERSKAVAFVEQMWELTYALEKRVQFPHVDVPGLASGEIIEGYIANDPAAAARSLRQYWGLGSGPVSHLVRTMELHGIIVTLVAFAGKDTPRIDAFSTSKLSRPLVVLTPDRADDVYRHRFTAAHELGHLLLHHDALPGDVRQEKDADVFAAEFLTPESEIGPHLSPRVDFSSLERTSRTWGVSMKSLIYRSRELGLFSEATARRAYQRLNQMENLGFFAAEPVTHYPGEMPSLLGRAFEVAESQGLTLDHLSRELKWKLPYLRRLLGQDDSRPELRLVQNREE